MGYVKIKVFEEGSAEDLQRWKDHMMEQPKCWNKFCYGCYDKENLVAALVVKEGNEVLKYITCLCRDCINDKYGEDILVNENHLMVETY